MKKEQGFSLIELLIVVAIIAIIAAIAVPSMLTSRMAANEAGAVQGCRTVGSAEVAYAAVNNQMYTNFTTLTNSVNGSYLDSRYTGNFNGYSYAEDQAVSGASTTASAVVPNGFGVVATPTNPDSNGRFIYGIAADQVVRFQTVAGGADAPLCGTAACASGDPIGKQ
jgi:type IV pilus assembly protein PilA